MLLWLVPAQAAPPIGFDEALREALLAAPSVAVADADRRAALGRARTAGTWLANPDARLEQGVDGSRAELGLAVPVAGQPFARAVAGDALHEAAVEQGALDRVVSALEVGRAYLEAERADQLARLASDSLAIAERGRDAARRLLEANEVSAVDAVTLAALAARAVQDATVAQQAALRARVGLEVALGREPTGETTTAGWPELAVPEAAGTLPIARIAADEARAARALCTLSRMDLVPTPTVVAGWEALDHGSGPIYGLEVQVPIFAPGLGAVRTAAAEADRATAVSRHTDLAARAAWTSALGELDGARIAFEASRIEGLEPALVAIGNALESGEYSLSEYTARRDALVDGLVTAIESRHRLEVARLALWELAGELPPEIVR